MSVADQALWIIERNSSQQLTLNSIAATCNVSRSHLASAFGTASGWPVMKYVKARRLSEAARKLAGGAPDILTVAFEFGYGSHEAFTRAFRDQFGLTPEQVRNNRNVEGLSLTTPLQLKSGPDPSPTPTIRSLDKLRVVGLSAPCSYNALVNIPAQWQRFVADYYADIPHKAERMPIGICQAPDDEGSFEYMCAVEVEAFGSRKAPLSYLEIGPRSYAVFEHQDHVSTIFDTYSAIWNKAIPALARSVADSQVLELHNNQFDLDTGLGGVTIWIPIEGPSKAMMSD